MTDLEMIRSIKQGHRNCEILLFNKYNFMIQKHAKHFRGHEEDYHSEAYESFREAIDYFNPNIATDENYNFGKIFRYYLLKQDDKFSVSIGQVDVKKLKNLTKGKTKEEIQEIKNMVNTNMNMELNENMNSKVSYIDEDKILTSIALERKEKIFLPKLSKKGRDVYTLYVKRGERNIENIANILGIKGKRKKGSVYYQIERINEAVRNASSFDDIDNPIILDINTRFYDTPIRKKSITNKVVKRTKVGV